MKSRKNLILTFGYGNRTSYKDLQATLDKYEVSCVVDIRKKPRGWSAIWNASGLLKFCTSVGVGYISRSELGNESGESYWIPPSLKDAEVALDDVSKLSRDGNILLLCAEKDWKRCHRTEVSRQLSERTENPVLHIS